MKGRSVTQPEDGFSLVEVMVVTLVIAIVIGIALPMFLGARARAEERRAEAQLRSGLTAGLTYWTDGGTFTGLDANCSPTADSCTVADVTESSVTWVGPAAPADLQVSIVFAAGNNLLLVARSVTGEYFCIAQSTGQSDRGRAPAFSDVDTAPECAGGW